VGLIMLRLLRPRRGGWIHRQVESVTISDPVVTERRVSLDFTLGRTRPVARNGNGEEIYFIPLTFMNKKPMVKFSLEDEAGKALPVLTYHRNCALALSVLVVLGELLAGAAKEFHSADAPLMPQDVIDDLREVVEGSPRDPDATRECLENLPCRSQMSSQSIRWRDFLTEDEEFMKAAHVFSTHFLLAVPLIGKPGVRRILKYSFEEHGDQPKLELPRPFRKLVQLWARIASGKLDREIRLRSWSLWLARGMGLKPMASKIQTPLMGRAGQYHFEVEAAEGLQITLAQLMTMPKKDEKGDEIPSVVVDECATSRQRVHLYSRVNEPGFVVVAARPRNFTIVRTGLMASVFSVLVLMFVAIFASRLVENIGATVSALLLAPAVLAAYMARPVGQPATNEAVFGLRALATLSGIWPLLAAIIFAAGTHCQTIAAKPGDQVENVCTSWTYGGPSLWMLLAFAMLNCGALLIYMTRVNRPPEQQRVEVAIEGADAAP
jgi:hypothetical protein